MSEPETQVRYFGQFALFSVYAIRHVVLLVTVLLW